jgi:hypothetical protein
VIIHIELDAMKVSRQQQQQQLLLLLLKNHLDQSMFALMVKFRNAPSLMDHFLLSSHIQTTAIGSFTAVTV